MLVAVAALFGATTLAFLPLEGLEFTLLALVALVFDHEAGELRVRGDTVEYRFERP